MRPKQPKSSLCRFRQQEKQAKTLERYKIGGNCRQNTNRKPRSLYRLVTSFRSQTPTSVRNRPSTIYMIQNRVKLSNGACYKRNAYLALIAHRSRTGKWRRCFRFATPPIATETDNQL
jgi:hypothetical protein